MSVVSGLLTTVIVIDGLLLVLIVMLQKGKGGAGLTGFGGGAQMLFGGSGGQDLFQKITWVLGAILMVTSLLLAIVKSNEPVGGYRAPVAPAVQTPVMPQLPAEQPAPVAPEAPVSETPVTPAQ